MQKTKQIGKPFGLPKFKTNESSLVSIIIPCFNSAKTLHRCLASVQKQTYKNLQIICINNGSTDKTAQILQQFEMQDNRIIVLQKSYGTVASARAMGYNVSTGEYLAFVDSDDTLQIQAIQKLVDCARATGADLVCCGYNKYFDGKVERHVLTNKVLKIVTPEQKLEYLKTPQHSYYSVWGKLYKKSVTVNFSEVQSSEDFLFNLVVVLKPIKVVTISYIGYNYFITGNNYSNELKINEWQNFCTILDIVEQRYHDKLAQSTELHYYITRRCYKALVRQTESWLAGGEDKQTIINMVKQTMVSPRLVHYKKLFCGKEPLEKNLFEYFKNNDAEGFVNAVTTQKLDLSNYR